MRDFEQIMYQMEEMLHADRLYQFSIEPGQGATYNTGKPTLYGYSEYPDSSVLAGQVKRSYIYQFVDNEEVNEFLEQANDRGFSVDVFEHSGYYEPDLSHLPDDGDY